MASNVVRKRYCANISKPSKLTNGRNREMFIEGYIEAGESPEQEAEDCFNSICRKVKDSLLHPLTAKNAQSNNNALKLQKIKIYISYYIAGK